MTPETFKKAAAIVQEIDGYTSLAQFIRCDVNMHIASSHGSYGELHSHGMILDKAIRESMAQILDAKIDTLNSELHSL